MRSLYFLHLIYFGIVASNASFAQIDVGKNAVSLELGGISPLASLNYERIFHVKEKYFLNGRIGIGVDSFGFPILLHGVTYCRGKTKHFLEAGLQAGFGPTSFGYADAPSSWYFLAPVLGYRLHPKKGFLFKPYISPIIPIPPTVGILFRVGLSLGVVF